MTHKPSEPTPADVKEDPERNPAPDAPEVPSEDGPAEQESSAHPS